MQGCVIGNGGRLTAASIKRFELFENVTDVDEFSAAMNRWWKEKHGHDLEPKKPKQPKRVKTDDDHKWCNGCESVLPVHSFCVDRSRVRGLANRCRECAASGWKRANHHLCKFCDSWCVGQVCRRCYFVRRQIRDSEMDITRSISILLNQTEQQMRKEIKCLRQGKKTLQQIRRILGS